MVSSIESQAEWTASRCFRLLRPIVSRNSSTSFSRPQESRRGDVRAQIAPSVSRSRFGDSPNPKLDPDWMVKSRNLAPRQYARLALPSFSDPVSELSAGCLSIPTPMVARIRGAGVSSEADATSVRNVQSHDIFSEKFVSQTDELNYRSQKLVQGTLDLVEATNSCRTEEAQQSFFPSLGAKSLRAMCCKRYARHIVALEHEQETQNAEAKFDIATEAYALIEETFDLGAGEYLRAITREQGIALFENMLADSRIPRSHVLALVRRMRNPRRSRYKHSSTAEIDSIAAALFHADPPDKPCCNRNNTYGHSFNSLAEISNQCEQDSRIGFEFRRFQDLVTSVMPVCWFGSRRLIALWTHAFRAFVDSARTVHEQVTAARDASRFLDTFVALDFAVQGVSAVATHLLNSSAVPDYHANASGCPKCPKVLAHARFMNAPMSHQPHAAINNQVNRKRLNTALNNSISSLFAILASFTITKRLRPEELPNVEPHAIMRLLGSLSMDILLASTSSNKLHEELPFERGTSILGATLVMLVASEAHQERQAVLRISINDLVRELETIDRRARMSGHYRRPTLVCLPELIISTARSSGKLLKNDGFEVLLHIANSLSSQSLGGHTTATTRLFLTELAVSSMLLFAERTGSKEAHELGSRLEKEMLVRSQHSSLNTPFKSTPRPGRDREGLKWEDTICEWIEATPDMVNLKHEAKAVNGESMRSKEGSARWGLSTHSNTMHMVIPSDDSSSFSDEEDQQHISLHEAGLSKLLLSPESLVASSPMSLQRPYKASEGIAATKKRIVPARDGTNEQRAFTSAEIRRPLAVVTNVTSTHVRLELCQQKGQKRHEGPTCPKRAFTDSDSDDSDDELSLPRPQKRTCVTSEAQISLVQSIKLPSEDETGLYNTSEDETSTSHHGFRRRNPRGKRLHTLSGIRYKAPLRTDRTIAATSQSDTGETDDELSFEMQSPAQRITCNH